MPIQVVWDDDSKNTIRQIYSGKLTLQDYIVATDSVAAMAKDVTHTVHSLMDRTAVISAPGIVIPAMRYANSHVPPNLGLRVVIKGDMFTRVVVDIGRRVAPRLIHDIYFVDTLEQGRAIIAKHLQKAYS
ncbi:MAG: hypothetical protein GC179_25995 [Anaerolineaceae bacterium]|nr:hypothetical protein [Anaerolineaceae bacterium]